MIASTTMTSAPLQATTVAGASYVCNARATKQSQRSWNIYIYVSISLSLSLYLSIYLYIYIYIYILLKNLYTCIYLSMSLYFYLKSTYGRNKVLMPLASSICTYLYTLLEKLLKASVESNRYLRPPLVPRRGSTRYWYRVKVPLGIKIFMQNILWLGFKPTTSCLARCSFTISPPQWLWLRRRYFLFDVTHGWVLGTGW